MLSLIQPVNKGYTDKVVQRMELERLRGQLETERSSFLNHWNDLGRFILPRRPRFSTTDVDRGNRRNQSIIDSTGGLAARTLRGGMMSAITPSSRPWFRLTTPDPDLAEYEPVKDWLYVNTMRMSDMFRQTNLYNSLPTIYGDMETFGTAAMMVEEDFEHVLRTYPFAIGSYYIWNDARLKVRGFMRDFRLTVRQIVEKFGTQPGKKDIDWTNISGTVKSLWDNGTTEAWMEVSHVVMPNPEWDPERAESQYKRYRSVYWERGSSAGSAGNFDADGKLLRDRGYDYFPILAPRWELTGEDVYGTYCPGMEALGDIQQLQMMERRGMQALEKSINPPMVAPSSLRTQKATVLPGDITYLDTRDGQQTFAPAYQINPNFEQMEKKEMQIRQRISKAFYEDLFLMLDQLDRKQITAEEVRERKEEKLLALGPVLEQTNQDLLDPLVEIAFQIMSRQGLITPAPEMMHGVPLRIEYTSVAAQAQKLLGIAGLERFSGFVGNLIKETGDPSIADKVNVDELVDKYGDMTAVPPGIIRDQDQVDQIRKQRAQQQQAQQQAERSQQLADAANKLGNAPMDGDNALTRLAEEANAGNPNPEE